MHQKNACQTMACSSPIISSSSITSASTSRPTTSGSARRRRRSAQSPRSIRAASRIGWALVPARDTSRPDSHDHERRAAGSEAFRDGDQQERGRRRRPNAPARSARSRRRGGCERQRRILQSARTRFIAALAAQGSRRSRPRRQHPDRAASSCKPARDFCGRRRRMHNPALSDAWTCLERMSLSGRSVRQLRRCGERFSPKQLGHG